jgi:hypothetical protein
MVKPARVAGEQTGVCESIGRPRDGLTPSGILLSDVAYSSREHDVLGSRRVDGQGRRGDQVSGSERVNRTSPEPGTLLVKVLGFFRTPSGKRRLARTGERALAFTNFPAAIQNDR